MKNKFLAIIFSLLVLSGFSQPKNEYRYLSVKLGLVNSFVYSPQANPYLLAHTSFGDMDVLPVKTINYTPGGDLGLFYNIDAKNDMFGIVIGVQIQNFGYTINYQTVNFGFRMQDQYRFTSAVLPFYIKYNPKNLFVNQVYLTAGIKQYINIMAQNYQTSSWNQAFYIRNLSAAEFHRTSTALFLGFNYNVFFVDVDYVLNSVINKDFRTLVLEGPVSPYENVNYKMNFYITTGVNLPLNRWLTARNWTAEKIRRLFNPVR